MTKYIKNEKTYDKEFQYEKEKINEAMQRRRGKRKIPTSIALESELIEAIKTKAKEQDVPYQVLIRMLIVNGFKRMDALIFDAAILSQSDLTSGRGIGADVVKKISELENRISKLEKRAKKTA